MGKEAPLKLFGLEVEMCLGSRNVPNFNAAVFIIFAAPVFQTI